jgi:hypothetical protein
MFDKKPPFPGKPFASRSRAPLAIALFALVGAASVVISLAASQDTGPNFAPPPAPGAKGAKLLRVAGEPDGSGQLRYTQEGSPGMSFQYPADWTLEKLTPAENSSDLYFKAQAPGTSISEQDEGQGLVIQGAIIEITAAPNDQYHTVDEVLQRLSGNVVAAQKKTVAGVPAVEYRLSDELEEESRPKLITTFFDNDIQYSVSLAAPDQSTSSPQYAQYQKILGSFKIRQ